MSHVHVLWVFALSFYNCFSLFLSLSLSLCFWPCVARLAMYMYFVFVSFTSTGHQKTMKSLSFTAIMFISLSIWLCIDGKGSKTGGSKGTPCFEDPTVCTDRQPSGKGSKGSATPYTIWCKDDSMEVCRNKDPKSHSIDRYKEKRCSFCSLVLPYLLSHVYSQFSQIVEETTG